MGFENKIILSFILLFESLFIFIFSVSTFYMFMKIISLTFLCVSIKQNSLINKLTYLFPK